MKASSYSDFNVAAEITHASLKIHTILCDHQPLIANDPEIAQTLNELAHWLHDAADGDKEAFDHLIDHGLKDIHRILVLLEDDADNILGDDVDQDEDEKPAMAEEVERKTAAYYDLRKELEDFEAEYLEKIVAFGK